MDATMPARAAAEAESERPASYRHTLTTRLTHWLSALAFFILVGSGLQIFNAAPYLDASDKSNPEHRVLAFGAAMAPDGVPYGYVDIFGKQIKTTGLFGYTGDSMGHLTERAFPGWLTLPGYQDLADGRRWHFFFAWVFGLAGIAYLSRGAVRREFGLLILRPADLPKIPPMALYYLRLRREPPEHGKYNPMQKAAYTAVLFVLTPLIVLTGLALSPGFDAMTGPLVSLMGGRQFARLWHFALMLALLGFVAGHLTMVISTGLWNNLRSMITGFYVPKTHEGEGR